MGLLLFRAFLVINVFSIGTENLVTPKPYRFSVYPVNKCPGSKTEFQRAAQKKNCTKGLRYLCAPNKYLSSLIEFCTDRHRSLYGKGNCVILEGTGDLDHYNCVEKFNRSCPSKPYYDEEIYKYPACLKIDKELRCFVADTICKEREYSTTETHLNVSKMEPVGNETLRGAFHGWLAIVYIIALVSAGIILILVIFRRREREKLERHKHKDETGLFLKDPQYPIEENDNIQKQNQMQTTSTKMLHEATKKEIRSKTSLRDEEENKESGQNAALINGIHQDNPEIDDDKLRNFLSKGKITVSHVRCIIVGCGKAGKTTLLKRLQNVSYKTLMQTKRTEIVDFHVNSFEVLIEEETIKKKEETSPTILFSKEKLEMPLKENAGKMTEERAEPGISKKDVSDKCSLKKKTPEQKENIPTDTLQNPANGDDAKNEKKSIFEPQSQDKTPVQNQSSPKTNEDIDTNVDKIDFENYAILKIKDAVSELLNETDLRPQITFLDFGGQSMYYPFHQLFLRPKSCSILVVDMTKSLNDKVDVEDNIEKKCSQFDSWRYGDYYKFWLQSIDSFSDPESPVIIVGTHADKLTIKECGKFVEEFLNFFDETHHFNLRRHLHKNRIYQIGFPKTGSELEDLKCIKKCIAEIVKSPCYLKANVRPVWALFEQLLIKMKEKEKVITRKILSEYSEQLNAQGFRIDDSEISEMLVFLHRVGIVLYFETDVLKDDIVLDIQWLFGAFKCIIKYSVEIWMNDTQCQQFYCTGELDDEKLENIWKTEGKGYWRHKTTIIAYMQQLGLLTELPSKELRSVDSAVYYFPSMNSKKFDRTGGNNSKSSILSFKFDEKGQLPFNVFHCIVFKCLKLNNWAILTEKKKKCLYQNAACFSFKKHVVVLRHCNFEIRVQVWASPDIYDAKLLKKIKHSIEGIIQENELLSYNIGYKCKKDVLNDETDVSFIPQDMCPSDDLCDTCPVDKKHEVDNDICWDNRVNEEKGNQTHRKHDDRKKMDDDVVQPVLQNHPDKMESTEGNQTHRRHDDRKNMAYDVAQPVLQNQPNRMESTEGTDEMAHGTREDWQAEKSTIERNKYMFLNQLHCDVTFIVGKAWKEIKAHKYVIARRSNVFEAMLFGGLSETSDVIHIPDIEPEIFIAMLRFLYFEEAEINADSVTEILFAADKYGIIELVNKCQSFLETQITEENICVILEQASLFNMHELFQKCQDVICESLFVSRNVFESQSFLDLSKHCLGKLVQSDRLPLDEKTIFDSLLHWAKEQCIKAEKNPMDPSELRWMLGDLLYHVRFPLMTSALFKEDIVPMKILSDEEVNEISDHFIGQRTQSTVFKTKQRNMVMSIYRIQERESNRTPDWNSNGEMDAIDFEANKAFQLHGILLFGSSGSYTYVVEVRISSITDGNRCLLHIPPISVSGKDEIFEIKFDKPCHIAPSQRYQISVKMKGQKKSFSAYFCDSYTHCDFTIKFFDSAYTGNGTCTSYGQIPGLVCFIPK